MFKRVLVPLDGSARAERALPLARRLAAASGGSLVLLCVVPESTFAPFPFERVDARIDPRSEAQAYLRTVTARPELAAITTETLVTIGSPAVQILSAARDHGVDVIVMCSHGRTGLAKWAMGSVAQQVARHSVMPVLVLKDGTPTPLALEAAQGANLRILIPLDGSPLAEAALAPALALLAGLGAGGSAHIHLLRLVDLTTISGRLGVDADQDRTVQTAITTSAQEYLAALADQVRQQVPETVPNAAVTWSVATGIDAAAVITETAAGHGAHSADEQARPYDLITMATHGRGGVRLWAVGSVTERVLTSATAPILIVRPVRAHEHPSEAAAVGAEPWSTPLF